MAWGGADMHGADSRSRLWSGWHEGGHGGPFRSSPGGKAQDTASRVSLRMGLQPRESGGGGLQEHRQARQRGTSPWPARRLALNPAAHSWLWSSAAESCARAAGAWRRRCRGASAPRSSARC